MILKLIAMAAGVLALVASVAVRMRTKRGANLATGPVSSDWLARARGRADDSL